MSAVADQIVGAGRRTRSLYVLVYRSIDHVTLRMLCQEITKSTLAPKYRVVAPSGRFHSSLTLFAERVIDLLEKRHACDYDPLLRVSKSSATLAISAARAALYHFQEVPADHKVAFLYLLVFKETRKNNCYYFSCLG